VSNGDTLWEIAKLEKNTNEYYKNKDIREIVFDIKKVNNLQTSDIYEHQKLLIPNF
jgi:LysM repeat protein